MSQSPLYNIDLELKALKTILTPKSAFQARLHSVMRLEYFHLPVVKAVFQRLLDSGLPRPPSWQVFLSDEDEQEKVLKETLALKAVVDSDPDLTFVVSQLEELSLRRALHTSLTEADKDLYESSKSQADTAARLSEKIARIAAINGDDTEEICLGMGYNQNAEDVFHNVVYRAQESGQFIKLGYPTFDTQSGGFQRGNLVIVGANSGGGKSLMALNIMVRQYLQFNANVILASYEMGHAEIMQRALAQLTEIEWKKIRTGTASIKEQRKIEAVYRKFLMHGAKNKNYFRIRCPKKETTVRDACLRYKHMKPDTIILDYINLLTSTSTMSESQWQMLGEIAKEGKLVAGELNCVVILLAQVDDQVKLRYSQAIKDHADFVMGWVRNEQSMIDGYITVKQIKARNAPLYDFQLITRYDIGTFRDVGEADLNSSFTDDEVFKICDEAKEQGLQFLPTILKEEGPLEEVVEDVAVDEEVPEVKKRKKRAGFADINRKDDGKSYI